MMYFKYFKPHPKYESHIFVCVYVCALTHVLGVYLMGLADWLAVLEHNSSACLTHAQQVCVSVKVIHITAGQGRAGCVLGH